MEQIKKEAPPMLTIPHKKIKSREATMTFLLDPFRLKSFILIFAHTSGALSISLKRRDARTTPGNVCTVI
jgi:hypothetical protein